MAKASKYDEDIARVEAIVAKLEQAEAISMEEYKKLAAEAAGLLKACHAEITTLDKELNAKS